MTKKSLAQWCCAGMVGVACVAGLTWQLLLNTPAAARSGVFQSASNSMPTRIARLADSPPTSDERRATNAAAPTSTNAFVVRAVDGDTLLVRVDGEEGEQRIRLLGINTPETVDPRKPVECFGKEASQRMHELVDGKRILLRADVQADERDKYSRLLRNVFLADGTDVNAMMVRDGYAYAYLSFPLNPVRKRELKKLEENAKLGQRGLWNPHTCSNHA